MRRRLAVTGALALASVVGVAGCAGSDAGGSPDGPSVTSPRPASPATAKRTTRASAPATTSALGAFPPVLSSSPPGVDSAKIRSVADLPAAFGCPANVEPIPLPESATSPAGVVCTSKLAGEALLLWFVDSPDARYLALTTAMARAKHVHAGPTWVAGGMIDPEMGSVGGEVHK